MEGDKAGQEGGKGKGGLMTAFSFFVETLLRRFFLGFFLVFSSIIVETA